jgi:DNA (cytosine-5)-methyltransferase 1
MDLNSNSNSVASKTASAHRSANSAAPHAKVPEQPRVVTCVDIFAGAGGLSLAAKNLNLNVVAAVELDKHACSTYERNLSNGSYSTTLYPIDIRNLDPKVIAKEHFSGGMECDLVLGGPPCQGFSVHRIKGAGVSDPRNDLLLRYFEYVKQLFPKAFLLENVPGLLWPRHKDYLENFYRLGKKAGYRVFQPIVLDARDFGVPQRRKRVFILGIRDGVTFDEDFWPPKATHGDKTACEANPELSPWVTAAAAKIFRRAPKGDMNNCHMNHSQELVGVFKDTPINGGSRHESGRTLPCHQKHNGHNDVYGRINPKEPGPTMTTACINPSKGRFVHPTQHHGITLRHAARFQTFPDDFIFEGGLMAAGVQIGNAVPIKLGEKLLEAVANGLGLHVNN